MSMRTLLEINHDLMPDSTNSKKEFMDKLEAFSKSGDPKYLPIGVTFVATRHHSGLYGYDDLKELPLSIYQWID